ncbi:MAG: hypothetical protein H6599_01045 [Flavobacteriales bacterium]|nr:hypothetical protein [Flavobacteriales bacterium]
MAKYKSPFHLNGTLGDMKFKDGKVVMVGASFSKKNPNQRVKENNQEFGGTAISATALLKALSKVRESFMDKTTQNRASAIMREILQLGTGPRGERLIDLAQYKHKLLGFELNSVDKFESIFTAPITTTVNADRNELVIDIPDFSTINDVHITQAVTHLKFHLALGVIGNHGFNTNNSKYHSLNDTNAAKHTLVSTVEIAIGGMVGQPTTLVAQLPDLPVLAADEVLIGALGIEFLEFVNGQYYGFDTDKAMQIIVAE